MGAASRKRRLLYSVLWILILAVFLVTGGLLLRDRQQAAEAAAIYQAMAQEETAPERIQLPAESRRVLELAKDLPQIKAWLRIDGTEVNYPVVQGRDNQTYLNILPDGTRNPAGSIFLDCRSTLDGDHLILYGHNMRTGAMFGSLKEYLDEEYLAAHPEFSLFTAQEELRCRIFAVRQVDAYSSDAYRLEPPAGMTMTQLIRQMGDQSVYPIPAGDYTRLVTLSTCTGGPRSQRLVIQAGISD